MSERTKIVSNSKIEGFTILYLPSCFLLVVIVAVDVYGNSFSDNQMASYFPKLGKR